MPTVWVGLDHARIPWVLTDSQLLALIVSVLSSPHPA